MSIKLKITLLLGTLFILVLTNSFFIFTLEKEADHKIKAVAHANTMIIHEHRLLSALKDAETGQRGYLLTQNPDYLDSYYEGLNTAARELAAMHKASTHVPAQNQILDEVADLIKAKSAELAETLELTQQGQLNKALGIVRTNKGKQLMDKIRSQLAVFANRERVFLEARIGDYRAAKARIDTLVVIEFLCAILLAALTWVYINRSLFLPLNTLIDSAEKIRNGKHLQAEDIVQNDEIGRVLTTFYAMSSKIQEREQKLRHQAHHDELTGLKNRTTLQQEITQSLSTARQHDNKIAVVLVDLDKFKAINDTYGHNAGDEVLRETAQRLQSAIRSSDSAFRIGGDEFVILLSELQNVQNIEAIARHILSCFIAPIKLADTELEVSISLGIAIGPDHSQHPEALIKLADEAMYQAKQKPSSWYQVFSASKALDSEMV